MFQCVSLPSVFEIKLLPNAILFIAQFPVLVYVLPCFVAKFRLYGSAIGVILSQRDKPVSENVPYKNTNR